MKFHQVEIPGCLYIEPDVFGDPRGFFLETYHAEKYAAAGLTRPLVQSNHSRSARGVLRGLHFQRTQPQGKLIYVVRGEIWDVAVDIRQGSPAYGRWVARTLSDENKAQFYVPEGCLHGFLVMSETADVIYACTDLYQPSSDCGVIWDDPQIGIEWPTRDVRLSTKDGKLPRWADLPADALPVFG